MKYVVMECHPAYSILMDETSRFVYAANLHYEVGQIVENPILMEETQKIQKSGISISISVRKIIAIAACLLLMIGSGVGYYQGNLAVYSTIVVSASADVSMQVNSHGKVLSLKSINLYGEQLLKNYDGKGKDKLLVTNELIQKAIAMGYLVSGDTVYFYIDTPKSAVYSSYKSELEQEMTAYADLNTAVEQYHINEPLPEKAPPETETTQETEILADASETIPETTVPESSTPEQEVTVQEEISPQPEITPQEEPVQPIQEEIPILNDVPQENSPQIQETEPDIPVNAPAPNEEITPTIENENSETSISEEEQPSEWNYEDWGNWYGYDNGYQMPEYSGRGWYDYDKDNSEQYQENWNIWGDWYHYDECETSECFQDDWNWDMWGDWNNWYDNSYSFDSTENENDYNWKKWKGRPPYYDNYSDGQEEWTTDPCEPEENF